MIIVQIIATVVVIGRDAGWITLFGNHSLTISREGLSLPRE
jgi:hypothetical protein